MSFKVAINGFGRIGRTTLRILLNNPHIEITAINDIADPRTLAHLLKFDTAQGTYPKNVTFDSSCIIVEEKMIRIFSERNPENLPWKESGIDLVLESTGLCRSREDAEKHLKAGAKKVLVSAPAKDVKTIVIGVNDESLINNDIIVSNASCTTNCWAPMVKVLDENWGIEKGMMTTTHSYTSDQTIQDRAHKDLRRARAAAQNIIPTTTGAAEAITYVLPHLKGKLYGMAIRVPVINGSLTEFNCILKDSPSVEEINRKFKEASEGRLKGILEYTEDPVVSSDIIGNLHSCVFDAGLTITKENMIKVVAWYDNETGYSGRLADLIEKIRTLR